MLPPSRNGKFSTKTCHKVGLQILLKYFDSNIQSECRQLSKLLYSPEHSLRLFPRNSKLLTYVCSGRDLIKLNLRLKVLPLTQTPLKQLRVQKFAFGLLGHKCKRLVFCSLPFYVATFVQNLERQLHKLCLGDRSYYNLQQCILFSEKFGCICQD